VFRLFASERPGHGSRLTGNSKTKAICENALRIRIQRESLGNLYTPVSYTATQDVRARLSSGTVLARGALSGWIVKSQLPDPVAS